MKKDCKEWLRELLTNKGPCDPVYVLRLAKYEGYKRSELRKAREELPVRGVYFKKEMYNNEGRRYIRKDWKWTL